MVRDALPTIQGFSIMKPAIFLDRDGVIIENKDSHVRSWQDVEIFPQAIKALHDFANAPYYFIIVTNQSVVGRGIISKNQADGINLKLKSEIQRTGGRIDAVYMCPHAPDDRCNCRKPHTGLIGQAMIDFDIDLSRSIMIGDAITDLQCAENAGIQKKVLVRTGRGKEQLRLPAARKLQLMICKDLQEAFKIFL